MFPKIECMVSFCFAARELIGFCVPAGLSLYTLLRTGIYNMPVD